jgi:hypothetical protein
MAAAMSAVTPTISGPAIRRTQQSDHPRSAGKNVPAKRNTRHGKQFASARCVDLESEPFQNYNSVRVGGETASPTIERAITGQGR